MSPAVTVHRCLSPIVLCLLTLTVTGVGQQLQPGSEPNQERLLNGLRVLIWPRPGDQDVVLKLRVHSGAAFDLAGKAGEMALLGDILFPDPGTREYFTDQMQGRLGVVTDYDSITITMQGRAREFERIVEILRNALVSTQLTPDVVAAVRDGRIRIVKETSVSRATVADRAIATRLFGDFPYGQPNAGSAESIGRVDRGDLMLARERFLNPNNSTLAVVGGVESSRVRRTLRQLLGSWRKSEQIVPFTFRQPQPPDPRTLIIKASGDDSVELRLAARGLSRSDPNTAAATALAFIMRQRWERLIPELARNPVFVRHEARFLPGLFVMGASVKSGMTARTLLAAQEVLKAVVSSPVSLSELEQARAEILAASNKEWAKPEGIAEAWLDNDTYRTPPLADQLSIVQRLTPADLQRVAATIFGKGQLATVVVGDSEQLKAELEREMPVEVLGETNESKPATPNATPKTTNSGKPD